jgi:hypothetical protein
LSHPILYHLAYFENDAALHSSFRLKFILLLYLSLILFSSSYQDFPIIGAAYEQNRGPLLPNGPKLSPTEIGFFIMKNIENSPFKLAMELYDKKYRILATVITLQLHRIFHLFIRRTILYLKIASYLCKSRLTLLPSDRNF